MKIAVCVKQVPEGSRRIDPETKRLDRSGEGTLNPFDANAVEEALRLKEAGGEGEVVLVSMGPPKAQDALRRRSRWAPTVRCWSRTTGRQGRISWRRAARSQRR